MSSQMMGMWQAPGNKSFIVSRYPSGVETSLRFRWLVIYYPCTILGGIWVDYVATFFALC